MPQLAALVRAKHPGAYDDLDDASLEKSVLAKYPEYADLATPVEKPNPPVSVKPVRASGDTFGDKIRNAADAIGARARGFGKSAAHTALDVAEMAGNTGMLPGQIPGTPNAAVEFGRAATAYRNPNRFDLSDPENQGMMLETAAELAAPAVEAGKLAIAGGRALATKAGPAAVELASHLPVVGTPIRWARTGAKILGHVLDMAAEKAAPNAGGRVVTASEPTLSQSLADALGELRQPAAAPSVQLPPPAELPAGYTPRTTVPKLKIVKPTAEPPAAPPPKRAYFLKSEADMAADAGPRVTPSGQIRVEDLPASWQARVGQDLFPMTEADAKDVGESLLKELTDRGVSVGKAMMDVSKNKDIPVQVRQQLLKSLSRVNLKGAQ